MKLRVTLIVVLYIATGSQCSENALDVFSEKLKNIFTEIANREKPSVPSVNLGSIWEHFLSEVPPSQKSVCSTCKMTVAAVLEAYSDGVPPEVIRDVVLFNCKALHIHTSRVCEKIVDITYPPLLYIVQHTEKLTSDRVCAIVHQASHCGMDDPDLDWSIDLGDELEPKQNPVAVQSQTRAEPLNILQLTDIHYDPNYLVGGNAECDEGYCCRFDQGEPSSPSAAAGRWGDYRSCDIPWEVVTDTLTHVKKQHKKIDYVYMTGDLIDHAVWDTTREKNNATFVKVLTEMKRSLGDIPVFPIIGNHEAHPFNLYAPVSVTQDDVSSAWLYETLADLWSMWLPEDTRETILRGGFYTVAVRPGFRVVVLNNNHCYVDDYWLIYESRDPDGQLQWLAGVLHDAEAAGEKVHLLYHVPTGGSDCYKRWSREFTRIVNRYQKTITGQFAGHTHNDEFRVFYSKEQPSQPISMVHIGGSLTPFSYINGNYRMYTVDPDSLDVLDYETWIYNLTASNLSPADTIPWEKMYSFKEAYGVDELTPQAIDSIAHRMVDDQDLVQQYFRFFNLNGDPQLEKGCDNDCMEMMICSIVTADSNDLSHCDKMVAALRAKHPKHPA